MTIQNLSRDPVLVYTFLFVSRLCNRTTCISGYSAVGKDSPLALEEMGKESARWINYMTPSQRREAPFRASARGEGTNSARLFTPGKRKAERSLKFIKYRGRVAQGWRLGGDVTVIWVPPCFVYPHTHIARKYVTVDLDVSVLFCYIKLY